MHAKFVFLLFTFTITMVDFRAVKLKFDPDKLLFWKKDNSTKCEPFSTYLVECNKCVCSADGTTYCTKMTCYDRNKLRRYLESESEDSY